jgi:DNA polymerase-3 subunit alpha
MDLKIDYDFEPAWDLICSGNTPGIFQLESSIGQHYSKLIKPRNIEELADVISLIRPGCLQAHMEDGKNLTEHYAMRKHGHEDTTYLIPQLEPILKSTYGILVYQEQAIAIGAKLAGLSPGDADYYIRKVIGKKKTDMMEETVRLILDGFKKNGINEAKGIELVNWIKAGQRYSFNKSHAVAFAYHSYKSAYAKALKMKKFFQVYLKHAKHKIKPKIEIRKLVQNARASEINIKQPDIRLKNKEFEIIKNEIRVGITDIKNVGDRIYDILSKEEIPDRWFTFLTDISPKIKSACIPLIQAGACDFYHMDRKKMEYEVKIFERFSDLEKSKLKVLEVDSLLSAIQKALNGGIKLAKNRKIIFEAALKDITTPTYSLEYNCEQLEKMEIDSIGAPLSCTRLDGNIKTAVTNSYCIDIIKGKIPKKVIIAGIVRDPRFIKTKKGDDMCFFSLEDHTGTLTDLVAFKECVEEYRYNIVEDLTVLLEGVKSSKGSLIVNRVIEI